MGAYGELICSGVIVTRKNCASAIFMPRAPKKPAFKTVLYNKVYCCVRNSQNPILSKEERKALRQPLLDHWHSQFEAFEQANMTADFMRQATNEWIAVYKLARRTAAQVPPLLVVAALDPYATESDSD